MVNQAVSLQCGINFTCEPFQIDVLKLYISNISNFRRHEKTLLMLRIPRIHSGCCPLTKAHAGKNTSEKLLLKMGPLCCENENDLISPSLFSSNLCLPSFPSLSFLHAEPDTGSKRDKNTIKKSWKK